MVAGSSQPRDLGQVGTFVCERDVGWEGSAAEGFPQTQDQFTGPSLFSVYLML